MLKLRLVTSLCMSVFVYVFIALLGGQDGIWVASQLREQKREISAHAAEIQKINDSLTVECDSLRHDRDVLAAYAKKMGYVSRGELLLKISGLNHTGERVYDTGFVMKFKPVLFVPEWVCKFTGILAGLLTAAVLLLNDYRRGLLGSGKPAVRERRFTGIPAYYDFSQA